MSYQALDGTLTPSIYTFQTLIESVAYAYGIGHAGKRFYIGHNEDVGYDQSTLDLRYGLVNIAAFLAQSQVESISTNACDEFHLDVVDGRYPASNSCGQFGRSYQDYSCSTSEEKAMQCPVVASQENTAVFSGKYVNSLYEYRPYFRCGPNEEASAYNLEAMSMERYGSNRAGRTDVKSCCFWGKGALMTKGVCNLGKLNYYLGARAANEERMAMFPDINFCSGNVCNHIEKYPTLVWDIAFFEWIERIQTYDDGQFNYIEQLHEFVDGGMSDATFINTVSKIVTNGSSDTNGAIV